MAVVVIEPDTVHGVVAQHVPKCLHPILAVARMRWTKALPAVGRRADLAVHADRRCVRVLLQVAGLVHRVELSKHLGALLLLQRQPLARDAAGAEEYRVDAIILQGPAPVEQLRRHSAINASDADMGSRPISSLAEARQRP